MLPRFRCWNKGDLLLRKGEGCRKGQEEGGREKEGRERNRRGEQEREGERGDLLYESQFASCATGNLKLVLK